MDDEKEFTVKVFDQSDIQIKGDHLEFEEEGVIKIVDTTGSVIAIFSVRNTIGIFEKERSRINEVGFTPES